MVRYSLAQTEGEEARMAEDPEGAFVLLSEVTAERDHPARVTVARIAELEEELAQLQIALNQAMGRQA